MTDEPPVYGQAGWPSKKTPPAKPSRSAADGPPRFEPGQTPPMHSSPEDSEPTPQEAPQRELSPQPDVRRLSLIHI